MTWFKLRGDARLGRCTTDGCGGQPSDRLEAGGVGSDYCSGCREEIERAELDRALAENGQRFVDAFAK